MRSLFASRHEFWCGRARYRLGHAWQAEHLGGRPLSGSAAERLLAGLLRGGDEHIVRNAYADFAEAFDLSRTSNDQILHWFSIALRGDLGGIGQARLVLVELGSSHPLLSQPRVINSSDGAAQRLSARCTAAGIRDLFHRGRRYHLAIEAWPVSSMQAVAAEALHGERAAAVLMEIAKSAATPMAARDLLHEAARFMTSTSGAIGNATLVLRSPQYSGAAAAEAAEPPPAPSQRSTPSQLRRPAAPSRETTDWIEIRFVDDDGKAIAAQAFSVTFGDGSTREGTLDDSGTGYLDGVPSGVCTVEFPGFSAHVVS